MKILQNVDKSFNFKVVQQILKLKILNKMLISFYHTFKSMEVRHKIPSGLWIDLVRDFPNNQVSDDLFFCSSEILEFLEIRSKISLRYKGVVFSVSEELIRDLARPLYFDISKVRQLRQLENVKIILKGISEKNTAILANPKILNTNNLSKLVALTGLSATELFQKASQDIIFAQTFSSYLAIQASRQGKKDEVSFMNIVNSVVCIFGFAIKKPSPKLYPTDFGLMYSKRKPKITNMKILILKLLGANRLLVTYFLSKVMEMRVVSLV